MREGRVLWRKTEGPWMDVAGFVDGRNKSEERVRARYGHSISSSRRPTSFYASQPIRVLCKLL